MSKYKKITYIILIITLIVIGTSLALWIRIREQNGKNEVASTCISLEIDRNTEGDAITMDDAFPLTDIDGLKEKRYTFTIVNGCSSYIFYNINLESLTSVAEEERIPIEYIKAIIDNNPPITLNNYDEVNSLLSSGTAYDTRMLDNGILYGNESRTFNLKLWLDEDTPKDYMEHAYEAKVTVYGELMKIDYGPVNAVTYLTNKVSTDNDLVYDDAIDTENEANNNIRYVGANPNNYVWFNDELWRIIGVMKGVNGSSTDDGSGETRIKIIRDESLGRFPYSESCLNENMVNNGDGTYTCNNLFYNNNWPSSTVNKILNDLYWNRETHISFNGYMYVNNTWQDYKTEIIDFRLNGLKKTAQNLIEPAMYYLGGYTITSSDQYYYGRMDSKKWYEAERNNRSSNNELTWTGNLGLMYPSDFGYASSEVVSNNRCNNIALNAWGNEGNSLCRANDWISLGKWHQWTITSRIDHNSDVVNVSASNLIDHRWDSTRYAFDIRPVAYLKSNVKIYKGVGTEEDPYRLAI